MVPMDAPMPKIPLPPRPGGADVGCGCTASRPSPGCRCWSRSAHRSSARRPPPRRHRARWPSRSSSLVNQERAKAGAGPVTLHPAVSNAAQAHSNYQAAASTMTHTGAGGTDAGDRIAASGYDWRTWGENVASGQPDAASRDAGLDEQRRPPQEHPRSALHRHGRRHRLLGERRAVLDRGLRRRLSAPSRTSECDTPSVGSDGVPSLRPRWPAERWASARAPAGPAPTVVASWVDGGLHLWGWDGAHTALPTGLRRAFDTPGVAGRPVPGRPPVLGRGPAPRRRPHPPGDDPDAERPRRAVARRARAIASAASRTPWPGSAPSPTSRRPPSPPGSSPRASARSATCSSPAGSRSPTPRSTPR